MLVKERKIKVLFSIHLFKLANSRKDFVASPFLNFIDEHELLFKLKYPVKFCIVTDRHRDASRINDGTEIA